MTRAGRTKRRTKQSDLNRAWTRSSKSIISAQLLFREWPHWIANDLPLTPLATYGTEPTASREGAIAPYMILKRVSASFKFTASRMETPLSADTSLSAIFCVVRRASQISTNGRSADVQRYIPKTVVRTLIARTLGLSESKRKHCLAFPSLNFNVRFRAAVPAYGRGKHGPSA